MAIIETASLPWFKAARFTLGLDVNESGFQGFYTGNRQKQSTLSDRLTGMLTLPASANEDIVAEREALVFGVRSAGDYLRMVMPHRRGRRGNLSGNPLVGADAAAGARSIVISPAIGINLLLGGSFEIDTDSNGRADGWNAVSIGSVSSVVYSQESGTPDDGVYEQGISANYGTVGASHEAGVERNVTGLAPGPYTLLANVRGDTNQSARIAVEWRNSGGSVISGATVATVAVTGAAQRFGATATAPAGTTQATVRLLTSATVSTGVRAVRWDSCAVKLGSSDLTWPGPATVRAADYLGIGGNIIIPALTGGVANDAGVMTLALALPLAKAVTTGAAVVHTNPTCLWEWDSDAPEFDNSPGGVQGQIVLPLRQVIA